MAESVIHALRNSDFINCLRMIFYWILIKKFLCYWSYRLEKFNVYMGFWCKLIKRIFSGMKIEKFCHDWVLRINIYLYVRKLLKICKPILKQFQNVIKIILLLVSVIMLGLWWHKVFGLWFQSIEPPKNRVYKLISSNNKMNVFIFKNLHKN